MKLSERKQGAEPSAKIIIKVKREAQKLGSIPPKLKSTFV
jgi:hypothetical protein